MKYKARKNINNKAHSIVFDLQETQWQHNPYGHEQREQNSIRTGNIEALKLCWKEEFSGKVGKLASDSLRSTKNVAVTVIGLSARSAIQGGVSPELAFSMADAFVKNMEDNLFDEGLVFDSIHEAELEFTKLVHKLGSKSSYNPIIRQAKDYISMHIHNKISIAAMAQEIGVNPNYLSTLFSKSENKTITDYITDEKLHLCENMLKYSDYTIQEISAYFAFSSQSYFTKLFKRVYGLTPGEYRQLYMRE
jgi:AraC-like DNA-binding protein